MIYEAEGTLAELKQNLAYKNQGAMLKALPEMAKLYLRIALSHVQQAQEALFFAREVLGEKGEG